MTCLNIQATAQNTYKPTNITTPLPRTHTPNSYGQTISYTYIMFSRSLLKQSRSAASAAIKPSTSASLASRAPSPFIVRSTAPRAFTSRLTSSRYYSSEAEKKTETAEGAAEATEGDAVQKELEAKNKEIVDLKVRSTYPHHNHKPNNHVSYQRDNRHLQDYLMQAHTNHTAGSLPPLRRRLPQPPRAHKARHRQCPHLRYPALRYRSHRVHRQLRPRSLHRSR